MFFGENQTHDHRIDDLKPKPWATVRLQVRYALYIVISDMSQMNVEMKISLFNIQSWSRSK